MALTTPRRAEAFSSRCTQASSSVVSLERSAAPLPQLDGSMRLLYIELGLC